MKLTQELIDKIQEAMLHTNLKGEIICKQSIDARKAKLDEVFGLAPRERGQWRTSF